MRLDTAERRLAARWYPKGAMAINHPEGLGVVYVGELGNGRLQLVAYAGTAGKPNYNYSMRSREQAEKWVSEWFDGLNKHKELVANCRADRSKPSTLKVGDVITNSWGYDQTNVDCYQITRTSEHFVWLRPIASKLVPDSGVGPMSGYVVPCPGEFSDKPEEKHKASGEYVTFRHGGSTKWDGEKKLYCSWYA